MYIFFFSFSYYKETTIGQKKVQYFGGEMKMGTVSQMESVLNITFLK